MRRKLCLLVVCAGAAAYGQYPLGSVYYPDDTIGNQVCITATSGGVTVPAPGIVVTFDAGTVDAGSGYHLHLGGVRPKGTYLGVVGTAAVTGVTGSDGCVTKHYQLPGIAGIYQFVVHWPDGHGGVNTAGMRNQAYYSTPAGPLTLYPGDYTTNDYDDLPADPGHPGYSEFFALGTSGRLLAASTQYHSQTITNGAPDLIEIYRGSLPWGGIADNETFGVYPWSAARYEEHGVGVEADVINKPNGSFLLINNFMDRSGCHLGEYSPDGVFLPDRLGYWSTKAKLHYVCASYLGTKSTLPGGPRRGR